MTANKFATMLHRNTHRMTLILVYAALEWILILMLLLNSFFSYFITKFASYFGLKPPCFWCSTVDHFLEPNTSMDPYIDLVCEPLAIEISNMRYCADHQKLTHSRARAVLNAENSVEISFSTWRSDKGFRCSCCNENLRSIHTPHLLLKPLWGIFENAHKGFLILEHQEDSNTNKSDLALGASENEINQTSSTLTLFCAESLNKISDNASDIRICHGENEPIEVMNLPFRDNEHCCDFERIIPLELIDSSTFSSQTSSVFQEEDEKVISPQQTETRVELLVAEAKCVSEEVAPEIVSECEVETSEIMVEREIQDFTASSQTLFMKDMKTASMEKPGHNEEEEKMPLLLKKKGTTVAESRDGSVVIDSECDDHDDGALTIESLKAGIESERKALSDLYVELDEERSAAAVAANETMAMITRLQEEKAAFQMEALQYQRMMEEQAEYDQEALQLLKELVVKREKEKEELKREVEMYKEKALTTTIRKESGSVRSRNSSASCSVAGDNDDRNSEERDENDVHDLKGKAVDCTLEESMAEFEEERLSIRDELKELEEKLFTLAGEEGRLLRGVKTQVGHFSNDFDENYSFSSPEEIRVSQGFSEDFNGKDYLERKIFGFEAKRRLPLFDSRGIKYGEEGLDFEKKVGIEEDIEHLYERLQALEADWEFLKHCVSSMKKGDKGMDLLQEILQHLRDLRTVEFQGRNIA